MKNFILSLIVLFGLTDSVLAQNPYYIHLSNLSGMTELYSDDLNDKAQILYNKLNATQSSGQGINFKVVGKDLYAFFANKEGKTEFAVDEAMTLIQSQYPNHLCFVKTIDHNSEYTIYPSIQLPSELSVIFSELEMASIKADLENLIFSLSNGIKSPEAVINIELAVMDRFIEILDGEYELPDFKTSLGFEPVFPSSTFPSVSYGSHDYSGQSNIFDYCGAIDSNSGVLWRDEIESVMSGIQLETSVIITSEVNDAILSLESQINLALPKFNTLGTKYVLWLHFDEGQLYHHGKVNMTESEAIAELEADFQKYISDNDDGTSLKGEDPLSKSNSLDCDLIEFINGDWSAKECLINENTSYGAGFLIGIFDEIYGTLAFAKKASMKIIDWLSLGPVGMSITIITLIERGYEIYRNVKALKDRLLYDPGFKEDLEEIARLVFEQFDLIIDRLISFMYTYFNELHPLEGEPGLSGYTAGKTVTFIVTSVFGGAGALKVFHKITNGNWRKIRTLAKESGWSNMLGEGFNNNAKDVPRCGILFGGCFVKDTPVLMANNNYKVNFGNTAKAVAVAASMPIIAVPIQDVQLLDYALAHETVNSTYGITASTDDDIYIGLIDKDPYTSDQQRERDKYKLDDENWNEVVFEEINGGSTAKLALHNDWINKKGYKADVVVEMNLPEQGIKGPFRITSIKHIVPQKKPIHDDESDDYDYRPVTALFTHESNQVYDISFDNEEKLGVTYRHPIYSTTKGDWKLAGELEVGEDVLTKFGNTKVVSMTKKEGIETVYNLEVKDLHNFLVSESGIVVHNNYGILQAIIDGIHNATKKWHKNYKCKEYGTALRAHLKKNGVENPTTIVYRLYDSNGNRVQMRIYRHGEEIAINGIHFGTPINGKMYDNLYHDGIEINPEDYKKLFEYPPHLELRDEIIDSSQKISKIF